MQTLDLTTPANPSRVSSKSSGQMPIPSTGALTKLLDIGTAGMNEVTIVGTVGGTGPLTNLQIGLGAAAVSAGDGTVGNEAAVLSGTGGDFATATSFLRLCSTSPHTTVTGNSFMMTLRLGGSVQRVAVFAAASAATTLTLDCSGIAA